MMTREAKTGLILGLIFIVAIAIVLRGVNDSGLDSLDKALAVGVAAPPPPNERPVVADAIAPEPVHRPISTDILPNHSPCLQSDVPGVEADRLNQQPPVYRHQRELPRSGLSVTNPDLFEPAAGIPEFPAKTQQALAHAIEKAGHTPSADGNTVLVIPDLPKPRQQASKVYVVEDGDDLSRIAVKFYGKEEGNRLVNINRIYQANKGVLPNMNTVRAGQKIKIPFLKTSQGSFVTVSQRNDNSPSASILNGFSGKNTYVVQDGDSLWSIAARKLGNGTRYPELVKLNKTLLKDEDDLSLGMKLRLPEK